jgi:uncharacterized protein (DUF433 family)
MQLENYFDFLTPDDIRVKGTRVGIETVLLDYLETGLSPEEITLRYPALSLEQVYAAITYYWRNRTQLDRYLEAWKAHGKQMRARQEQNPPPGVQRLRAFIRQRAADAEKGAAVTA